VAADKTYGSPTLKHSTYPYIGMCRHATYGGCTDIKQRNKSVCAPTCKKSLYWQQCATI